MSGPSLASWPEATADSPWDPTEDLQRQGLQGRGGSFFPKLQGFFDGVFLFYFTLQIFLFAFTPGNLTECIFIIKEGSLFNGKA